VLVASIALSSAISAAADTAIVTKVVEILPLDDQCRSWIPDRGKCMETAVDVLVHNATPFPLVVTTACTAFDSTGKVLGEGRSDSLVRREHLHMQPFGRDIQEVHIGTLDYLTVHHVDCRATTELSSASSHQ
jgi:hypothetical protein